MDAIEGTAKARMTRIYANRASPNSKHGFAKRKSEVSGWG